MESKAQRKNQFNPIEVTITLENQDEVNFLFELFDIVPSTYKEWREEEYPLTVDFDEENINKNNLFELLEPYIEDRLPF